MNKIIFKLSNDQFILFKKYIDYSELSYISFNEQTFQVIIYKKELSLFQDLIIEASTIYGLDSDGEITEFGRELEALYDTIYSQIKEIKAPN